MYTLHLVERHIQIHTKSSHAAITTADFLLSTTTFHSLDTVTSAGKYIHRPFTLMVTLSSYFFPSTSVTLHVNIAPFSPVVLASMVNVRCWLYDFSKESSTPTRNHSILVEFRLVEQFISLIRPTMNGFSWPRISTATREQDGFKKYTNPFKSPQVCSVLGFFTFDFSFLQIGCSNGVGNFA